MNSTSILRLAVRLAAILIVAAGLVAAHPPAILMQKSNFPFTVGTLRVEKFGRGERVLIFVPGLACGSWVWDDAVERYQKDFTVYTVTIAGFDGLAATEPPYLDKAVASLAELVRSLRLRKPTIIGHSLGGLLAMRVAQEHTDLVGKVVIVDSLPIMPPPVPGQSPDQRRAASEAFLGPWRMSTADEYAKQQRGFVGFITSSPAQADLITPRLLRSDRATVAGSMAEMWNSDLRPGLAKISVPVLVLVPVRPGVAKDVTLATYAALYAGTPTIELVPIVDTAHFLMLDKPDVTYAAISKFIGSD